MTETKRRTRRATSQLSVAVAFALVSLAANGAGPMRAAETADPFRVELRDAQGKRIRLTDFMGKIVVVDLWASWCAPCRTSFSTLDALSLEYRFRGVEVVAVNLDRRRRDAEAFLAAQPHRMLVVFDPRARMLEAFGAAGIPSSLVIDRQGTIRYRNSGDTAGAEARYRQQLDALVAEPAR
jgi:thiol-disulfide isomerase/thioredoxin